MSFTNPSRWLVEIFSLQLYPFKFQLNLIPADSYLDVRALPVIGVPTYIYKIYIVTYCDLLIHFHIRIE